MRFGERARQLRLRHWLTQGALLANLEDSTSYICKVESEILHFGDYPSEKFIHKMDNELNADEDDLLLLADKVPSSIRNRFRQRPALFRKLRHWTSNCWINSSLF